MDLTEQLRVLDAAQGHPAKLALATVDLAYPELPEAERTALKQSLEAAAIPHWCDQPILSALLEISPKESAERLAQLAKLTVLEPFRARGEEAINVHEATRLALRKAMAAESPERFRTLSRRVATLSESDVTPRGRIEWIYHLLCYDPERGATELEKLNREWSRSATSEDLYALTSALQELETTGLVQGRARVWTRLAIAWTRVGRGEAAQLEEWATVTMRLAEGVDDQLAQGEAHCLVGDVLQAQGNLAEALLEFAEYQKVTARLADEDPSDDDRLADLGVAHNRLGGVLEAQGKAAEAHKAFAKSLEISARLVEQEPSNAGRRRDLAAAHSRVGAVLQAQGKLPEAKDAFGKYLTLSQELVDEKPSNAGWQQLLAGAHARIGEVLQAQGQLPEALTAFGHYLSISLHLVELEPTNAGWLLELAAAHSRIGDVLQAQEKGTEAQKELEEYLEITQQLVSQDPTNSDYQKHLVAAHSQVGEMLRAQGKLEEARDAFGESLAISQLLAKQDTTNAGWQLLLATAHRQMGQVLQAQDKLADARKAFAESLLICQRLVDLDPSNVEWQRELFIACLRVARLDFAGNKYQEALPLFEQASSLLAAWNATEWDDLKKSVELELAACRASISNGQQSG